MMRISMGTPFFMIIITLLVECAISGQLSRSRANDNNIDPANCPNCGSRTNIVYIWFDDLAFADIGFNGGSYPSPILDNLANNNAIKINFHYAEQVCTASRSALMTGRYSWLSGANKVIGINNPAHYNSELTLWPQILDNRGYTGFIAGKWHIGYNQESDLPHKRGFKKGLFSHNGPQYYSRGYSRSFSKIDEDFGEPSSQIKAARKQAFGTPLKIPLHDTYRIDVNETDGEMIEIPVYVGDESYNEELWTKAIKQFIQETDSENEDIFIYFSQWTPHSSLVEPPTVRPDGETVIDYSHCTDADIEDEKKLFCKQVHYASQNIEEIIDELKMNDLYDDTLIIITSDNGAAPTSGGNRSISFGSSLPLRGVKSGSHEGGLRTPAILKGGVIDSFFEQIGGGDITECEYNGLIHVSDWYHIIIDVTNSKNNALYEPDDDHRLLQIWDDIKCECNPHCNDNNNRYEKRDELIMMRKCENTDILYSAYLRKGDWKLVINGSNMINDPCPIPYVDKITPLSSYSYSNSSWFATPNETYYDRVYSERADDFPHLYGSYCLDDLYETLDDIADNAPDDVKVKADIKSDINRKDFYLFQYDELMLFNITDDKVEACNVALNYSDIVDELYEYALLRSDEYDCDPDAPSSIGSLKAQFESFDCITTYTKPWNNEGNDAEIDDLWEQLIAKKLQCNDSVLIEYLNDASSESVESVEESVEYAESVNVPLIEHAHWTDNNKDYDHFSFLNENDFMRNIGIPLILTIMSLIVTCGYCCIYHAKLVKTLICPKKKKVIYDSAEMHQDDL